jgi:transcriptional regulator GlxA family with amidase domain
MVTPILRTIAELFVHAQSGALSGLDRRWRHREHLLKRVDQYLHATQGMPFDSKDLAAAVGATERSIQMHFQDAYGITPGQWARCLALHRVRQHLLKTDPRRFTVEGVARAFGFRHMGRFSAYYEELFGEFPSDAMGQRLQDHRANSMELVH